ncbi:MAG: ribosome maturation factor RimM [Anaerococcus sp.]|jgi:16S rRNA processing protein RimM|nr:ribosome maturation factor RimM [Peptoniphilaceae bacterium]MDY3055389.1 ribosome maturation factor RimM [Anaerococcus sp.]
MRILVAEILRTQGIKGNLKIKSFTDNEDRFKKGSKLFLDDKEVVVESSFKQKDAYVIKLEGYDDINEVSKFIGHELTIDEADLMDLSENEFFIFDLEGLDVYEKGAKIGYIKEVITKVYPNDIFVIKTKDGKEVYFPALKATVENIDLENKKVEVKDFEDYE